MRTIVLIPAKGNSARLPIKNLMKMNGIPMVEYSLIEACKVFSVEDICLVSEDIYILEIGLKYGVKCLKEPLFLLKKEVPAVCEWLSEVEKFDVLVLLHPTSPLRLAWDIEGAYDRFLTGGFDSLYTVFEKWDNGSVLISKRFLIEQGIVVGGNVGTYSVPMERSVDVNNIWEFRIAESLLIERTNTRRTDKTMRL